MAVFWVLGFSGGSGVAFVLFCFRTQRESGELPLTKEARAVCFAVSRLGLCRLSQRVVWGHEPDPQKKLKKQQIISPPPCKGAVKTKGRQRNLLSAYVDEEPLLDALLPLGVLLPAGRGRCRPT